MSIAVPDFFKRCYYVRCPAFNDNGIIIPDRYHGAVYLLPDQRETETASYDVRSAEKFFMSNRLSNSGVTLSPRLSPGDRSAALAKIREQNPDLDDMPDDVVMVSWFQDSVNPPIMRIFKLDPKQRVKFEHLGYDRRTAGIVGPSTAQMYVEYAQTLARYDAARVLWVKRLGDVPVVQADYIDARMSADEQRDNEFIIEDMGNSVWMQSPVEIVNELYAAPPMHKIMFSITRGEPVKFDHWSNARRLADRVKHTRPLSSLSF